MGTDDDKISSIKAENKQRDNTIEHIVDRVNLVEIKVARIDERQAQNKEDLTYLRSSLDTFQTQNSKQHGEVRELLGTLTHELKTDKERKKETLERRLIQNRWIRWGGTTLIGLILFGVGLFSSRGGS